MMTLLIAGHETTAAVLTWTFYLLAQHPEVAEKIREEVSGGWWMCTQPADVWVKEQGAGVFAGTAAHVLQYGEMLMPDATRGLLGRWTP